MILAPFKRVTPKVITIPERGIKCLANSVIVKDTDVYVQNPTLTIILPDSDRKDFDKILEIGEVVTVGSNIQNIFPGDILLYRRLAAFYIPNGIEEPYLWMFDEFAVVAKIHKNSPR